MPSESADTPENGVAHDSPDGENDPEPFKDGFTQASLRLIEFPGEEEPWAVYLHGGGWLQRIGSGESVEAAMLDSVDELEGPIEEYQ